MSKPQFPSLGEVVKALFDYTGILPQKNDKSGVFSNEKTKKTIQAQLRRLAKEESELAKNLSQLITLFEKALLEAINDERIVCACIASLGDLLTQYGDLIREDGTYLAKKDSIKWLIRVKLLDRIIISYQKNLLKFNVAYSNMNTPSDVYWWLPEVTDYSIKLPIAKVFSWIYETTETNQTHFHFPNIGSEDNHRLSQNLENVSRWCNGKQVPSWGNLSQNFMESITALQSTHIHKYKREVTKHSQASFNIALFFARLSSTICMDVDRQFGREFLIEVVQYMKKQDRSLKVHHSSIKSIIHNEVQKNTPENQIDTDAYWFYGIQTYWENLSQKITYSGEIITERFQRNYQSGYNFSDLRFFLKFTPAFMLRPLLKQRNINLINMVKPLYFDLLFEGISLRKNTKEINIGIPSFIKKVTDANLSEELEWLVCWNLASYYYRRDEHELAFPYYKAAYEQAKYSAGKDQYLLVNQYIESCAKNDKFRDFKKGIAWANYLGIEIRWLRNMDYTEANLAFVYEFMKKAKYVVI